MKKVTKIIVALLLAAVVCVGFAACGSKEDQSGKYLIATDTTFAPFEFKEGNDMIGIDMDLLAAIAKDQGFEYDIQVVGFNAAVQGLESEQYDAVIAGMSITEERQKKFDFSDPYFDSGVGMAVKSDNAAIKSYADLKGQKVAVKTGTEGADFANSVKDKYGFEITTFEDSANMYEDVKSGNSVACFEDYPVLGYAITKGQPLKMVGDKEQGSSYGFAVNKGKNADLLKMFNAGLANLQKSGEYQKILDKYIAK